MKKIIAAFDGLKLSASTIDYAIDIAKACNAHLLGIFLDDVIYHSYRFSDVISKEGGVSDRKLQQLNKKDEDTRKRSIQLFKKRCEKEGIRFSVHRDRNAAVKDLLHESIYCDMLIIGRMENFATHQNEIPSEFMRDVLTDVQCPVLIVPGKYTSVEKVILLYDGDPSAVYAIKMFSYMQLPFKDLRVEVISVISEEKSLNTPDKNLMDEFLQMHFSNAKHVELIGRPEAKIIFYLQNLREEALVVLGAYRRSRVSRWFKPSMADYLMANLELPLFVAHNK
jgi:nucleotide-binding universal stress UspA family protein